MDNAEYIQQEYEWADLPWKKFEKSLYKLQKRIYQASIRDDVSNVRRLQKLLIKSRSAKLIAVRRVTQDNKGKKTAGVDGVKTLSPKKRFALVDKITLGTKASPVRRIWIPKPGNDEKRPLGIPTIYDRTVQCLLKLALEPEWEAKFEPNSYGFRPGRSCQDAIEAIFNAIRNKSKYVLDADISKCFDRIDHQKLLDKLNTSPSIRRQVRAWLKAGMMYKGEFSKTTDGTPQGGVLSPLLANIALHGMEHCINRFAEGLKMKYPAGNHMKKEDKIKTLTFIRYADDFVIIHKDYSVIKECQKLISEWLKNMGLELKPSKTRLTHTLHNVGKEKAGFNFLGFNIRQHKVGKYNSGKNSQKQLLGFKTIIQPSQDSIKKHYRSMVLIIDKHKSSKQEVLIGHLNPVIRGWCNYFSTSVCKKVFSKIDNLLHWKLYKWAVNRHRKMKKKDLKDKYFHHESSYDKNSKYTSRNWIFSTTIDEKIGHRLLFHSDTKAIRFVKVKGKATPYDGNLIYWSTRLGRNPLLPFKKARLLKTHKGLVRM